jgi:hypothetical protein
MFVVKGHRARCTRLIKASEVVGFRPNIEVRPKVGTRGANDELNQMGAPGDEAATEGAANRR